MTDVRGAAGAATSAQWWTEAESSQTGVERIDLVEQIEHQCHAGGIQMQIARQAQRGAGAAERAAVKAPIRGIAAPWLQRAFLHQFGQLRAVGLASLALFDQRELEGVFDDHAVRDHQFVLDHGQPSSACRGLKSANAVASWVQASRAAVVSLGGIAIVSTA